MYAIIIYVHSMYAVCMQCVCSMYAVCMQCVCSVYAVCMQCVCSMYAVCMQCSMYDVCSFIKFLCLLQVVKNPRPALHVVFLLSCKNPK